MRTNCAVALLTRTKTGEDEYGNDILTDSFSVMPGLFWPGTSSENTDGQDTVTDQPTIALLPGSRPAAIDAVVINPVIDGTAYGQGDYGSGSFSGQDSITGDKYEVDGQREIWVSPDPTRGERGVVVKLKAVT